MEVHRLINGFNSSQSEFVIKPVYKGDYLESLTSFAAAFRAKKPPSIVQVFEVGTPTMLAPAGIIKPLEELLQEQGKNIPKENFLPAVLSNYSVNGKLLAMPFNISLPVIFYNEDALRRAGYSPESFPKTWNELEKLAQILTQVGFSCAYTTAYPAWIQIESFSAIHHLPLISEDRTRVAFNNEPVVGHLERLLRWQKMHYFEYGGRTDDATSLFTSGRCAMFSQSSGSYNSLNALVPFKVGMAALPLDDTVRSQRANNVSGGAALWAVAGQSALNYQGVARFFTYLSQPKIQHDWHQRTGYLPIGVKGVYANISKISSHPSIQLAKTELSANTKKVSNTAGMQNQIRLINDEAIELIFAGIKSPREAMNDAARRANHAMFRFKRNTHLKNG